MKRLKMLATLLLSWGLTTTLPSCHTTMPNVKGSSKSSTTTKKGTNTNGGSKTVNGGGGGSSKPVSVPITEQHRASCKKLGVTPQGTDNQTLYSVSASWLGTKYKYGGQSRDGVDCSGLTGLIYKSVYKKSLSRSSADILANNCQKIDKKSLKEGDLVFFRTDGKKSSTPNHVGVYLKENKFIHASTSKGVIVSDMNADYYVKNYIASGRVVK